MRRNLSNLCGNSSGPTGAGVDHDPSTSIWSSYLIPSVSFGGLSLMYLTISSSAGFMMPNRSDSASRNVIDPFIALAVLKTDLPPCTVVDLRNVMLNPHTWCSPKKHGIKNNGRVEKDFAVVPPPVARTHNHARKIDIHALLFTQFRTNYFAYSNASPHTEGICFEHYLAAANGTYSACDPIFFMNRRHFAWAGERARKI